MNIPSSNYAINGIKILLCEDCLLSRYYPLIEYKDVLTAKLPLCGGLTRDDCLSLSDEQLLLAGLPDNNSVALFRRFLRLYDYKGKGLKDIPDADKKTEEEILSLLELMRLPGVKFIRANLYFHCGYKSLSDFAANSAEEIKEKIIFIIERDCLPFAPPLLKELRTQIAVAKLFTQYAAE